MKQASIAELRARIEQALADAAVPIGTHHWPATADVEAYETPAIWVGQVPEGVTVDGLEVLISESSDPQILRTFAGTVTIDRYPVRLVAHEGKHLTEAFRALAQAFGNRMSPPDVLQGTDRYPDQMLVTVTP